MTHSCKFCRRELQVMETVVMANMVVCFECSKRLSRLLVALSRGRGTDTR